VKGEKSAGVTLVDRCLACEAVLTA